LTEAFMRFCSSLRKSRNNSACFGVASVGVSH